MAEVSKTYGAGPTRVAVSDTGVARLRRIHRAVSEHSPNGSDNTCAACRDAGVTVGIDHQMNAAGSGWVPKLIERRRGRPLPRTGHSDEKG